MAYICNAAWTALPGTGDAVFSALEKLAVISRLEAGNRTYEVFRDGADDFRIVEVYDDEHAFEEHLVSQHFARYAIATALPLLASRSRSIHTTAEPIEGDLP